jgi:HlyD family secretion protein
MAQPPSNRITGPAPTPLAARPAGGGVATVADHGDVAAPILLEFESPSAALLALPVPFRSRFVIWMIASMFFAMLLVAFTYPIDRVVVTNGKVVATDPNVVVQPLEVSIVRSIKVEEGQLVKKGDLLAELDPTFAGSDAAAEQAQEASLQAEVNRLQAEMDGRPYVSDGSPQGQLEQMMFTQRHAEVTFKLENYNQQIGSLRAKIDQANSDIRSYSDRLVVATRVEAMRKELEKLQVGSQLNTLAATDNRVEMSRFLEAARAALAGAQRDLDAEIAERDGYLQQFRSDTGQLLGEEYRKLADMRGSAEKSRLRHNLVDLRADRDAIVLSIAPISVGSVMASGDQFFTLVPIDSPLEIESVVDGRDAGFVRLGDPVTIKFQTFPYFTYGIARGVLRVMSPDSFHKPMDDMDKVGKPRSEEAAGTFFYRAKISLDKMMLHDLPPDFRLTPGMPVQADVKVGTRTVIQYLLSRVIPATTEGMHEP